MSNIFDGLAKIPDVQLLDQVALLESINMVNISKPYVAKAKKGVVNALNGIGKLFGKDFDISQPEEKELVNYIDEKRKELSNCRRSELEKKLINDLVLKSKLEIKTSSLDKISVKVIEEASLIFKISEELTPAQKADAIHQKFTQRLLYNMQKKFKKQNREEVRKTEEAISKSLQGLTQKQKDEIKDALNVEKLTGEAVRQGLLKTDAHINILEGISKSGFGGFVALNTIINAAYRADIGITAYANITSVSAILEGPLGFIIMFVVLSYQITNGANKLDRELLSQIVWFAVNANKDKFTPKDEELPSWVSVQKKSEVSKDEEKYKLLVKEKEIAVRLSKENNEKLEKLIENQRKQELLLEQERRNLISSEEKLNELELNDQRNTLEDAQESVIYQKQMIQNASSEIDSYIQKNKILDEEKVSLEKQNDNFRSTLDISSEKVEKLEEVRREFITQRWSIYFSDFKVDTCAIRDVVRFNVGELQAVEKALMELYNVKNPRALSLGKIKENTQEYDSMGFLFPDGLRAIILYKVSNSKSCRVEIVKVYKDSGNNNNNEEIF